MELKLRPFYTGYRLELLVESDRGKRRRYYFYEDTIEAISGLAVALTQLNPPVWHITNLIINYFKNGQKQKI